MTLGLVLMPLGAALVLALAPLQGTAARRVSTGAAAGLLVLASFLCFSSDGAGSPGRVLSLPWLPAT